MVMFWSHNESIIVTKIDYTVLNTIFANVYVWLYVSIVQFHRKLWLLRISKLINFFLSSTFDFSHSEA